MRVFLNVWLVILLSLSTTSAWQENRIEYYVEKKVKSPQIDGIPDENEWVTEEQTFETSITPVYFQGITRVYIDLIIIRDESNLYILLRFENSKANNNSFSAGIALSGNTPSTMSDYSDNKIAYFDGNTTKLYDLNNCEIISTEFDVSNFMQPCKNDTITDFLAEYGFIDNKHIIEFSIPLTVTNTTEDINISHGTYLSIIVNIYGNIYNLGHGGISTNPLKLIYSKLLSEPIFIVTTIILSTIILIKLLKKLVPKNDRI